MMKRLFVALLSALLLSAAPTRSHERADQLGKVGFPTSCDAKVQAQFERGVAMIHSVLVRGGTQDVRVRSEAGSVVRNCLLGYCYRSTWEYSGGPAIAPSRAECVGGARESTCDRREDPARARLDRSAGRVLQGSRQGPRGHSSARLRQRDAGNDATLSGRLRGMDLPCADASGYRARTRQDIREPAQVGGDPRETPAAAAVRDKIAFVGSPLGVDTAIASIPARLALETADWKGAAALPVVETRFPAANSLNRFARGLGMARSGNASGAKGEIQAIGQIRSGLDKAGDSVLGKPLRGAHARNLRLGRIRRRRSGAGSEVHACCGGPSLTSTVAVLTG